MKSIQMLVPIAGSEYVAKPGDVVEVPEAEADRLIEAGYAVALEAPEVEPKGSKKGGKK